MQSLPFEDAAFDLVWCRDVIEIVEDLPAGIAEILGKADFEHFAIVAGRSERRANKREHTSNKHVYVLHRKPESTAQRVRFEAYGVSENILL